MTETEHQGMYPIRTVSELTGVNSVTLRAWERRYGLIKPHRTDSGHRLYSRGDIDLIQDVVKLLDQGMPISQVSHIIKQPSTTTTQVEDEDFWQMSQDRMIGAISRFDEITLERIYSEAMSIYPVDIVTRHLVVPLLARLGERWENMTGSVAEEHFFAIYMRNKLGARFHHRQQYQSGPKLLMACLPGEQHELGLLLFALAAHDRGYRLVLLGSDMPLNELKHVVQVTHADGVVLSASIHCDQTRIYQDLATLVGSVDIPVFVGGKCSVINHDEIGETGAYVVGDDTLSGLQTINEHLRNAHN